MVQVTTKGHADKCSWSVLLPEPMSMSMGHVATENPTDLSDLHCYLRPYLCLWSGQALKALSGSVVLLKQGAMFAVCTLTRNHVEAHDRCSC